MTEHASVRMSSRRLNEKRITTALLFGREVHAKGITFFVVGRKEVEAARQQDVDIADTEGVHVLCGRDGAIVTTYRNRDLRGVRPNRRGRFKRVRCR